MKNFDFLKRGDKLLFVLALAVLAAGLFGVWQNSNNSAIDGAAPTVTLVFAQWWDGDLERNTLQHLAREFENLHEGIKITFSSVSYEDLRLKLFDVSDDIFPVDVLALDPLWAAELQKMGIVEDLSASLLSFISVLYYNIDILRDAGFSMPPKSRGEFVNYARAVVDSGGNRSGLVMNENGPRRIYDDVYPWIWSAGAQLIRDGSPTVDSRPVVESLSFLASLKSEGLAVYGNKLEDFCSGKAAFMISSAKDINLVRNRLGEESFDISSVPIPDNYAGITFCGNAEWAVGVNSASAHREEARLFAGFLAEKAHVFAENTGLTSKGGGMPSRDPFYSKAWDIAMAWEAARDFSGLPWTEPENVFSEELSSLFSGASTPARTAAAIQRRWADLLSP